MEGVQLRRIWKTALALLIGALAVPALASAQQIVLVTNGDTPASGLAAFTVAADGSLSPAPGSPHQTGQDPAGVAVSPDGRHAFVANFADDTVSSYSLSADGALSLIATTSTSAENPFDVTPTPDGNFLLVTGRSETTPRVTVFAVADDGTLTQAPGSPVNPGIFDPRAVAVSPDGRFAYVTGRRGPSGPPASNADQALAVLAIGANGSLTPIVGSPFFETPTNPFEITITPDGARMYMTRISTNQIQGFSLNPTTGAPSNLTGSPFAIGNAPLPLVSNPTGDRLALGNAGVGESIQTIDVNPTTGALAANASLPVTATADPHGMAFTPVGDRLYATLLANPGVGLGLSVGASGALTQLPGSPFATGGVFPGFFGATLPPVQTPEAAIAPLDPAAGKPAKLDASGTVVRGGSATRYDWDFGDGTTLADGGPTPTHTYALPGTYNTKVTVTNDCNPQAPAVGGVVSVGNQIYCNGPRQGTATRPIEATNTVDGTVTAKKKQKLKPKGVKFVVQAYEELLTQARGQAKQAGGQAKFKRRSADVAAGTKKVLRLKPKRKAQKRIQKALDRGRKPKAKITVNLTDSLGTQKVVKLTVKYKRSK